MNLVLFSQEELYRPLPKQDPRVEHVLKILHKGVGEHFDAGIFADDFIKESLNTSQNTKKQDSLDSITSKTNKVGRCTILSISEKNVMFDFEEGKNSKEIFPLLPIQIIIGFPRPIQLKRILRDVSSLGVEKVFLVGTELGEKSYLDSKIISRGTAKADLIDGAAQARSVEIPQLFMYRSLQECFCDLASDYDKIVCDVTTEAKPLGTYEKPYKKEGVVLAIGSERGWSENERILCQKNGFNAYSIGKRILRTETACVAGISVLLSRLGIV